MSAMRLRFAPSPTGQLHVGNARTALYNWLLARGQGGTFVLRIEDTDAERSTRESELAILEDLKWLGLTWDEGPDTGGPFGPYRQSERLAMFARVAAEFLERRLAYRCFCTAEQLEAERQAALAAQQPPKYSGRCRAIDPSAAAARAAAGEPAAIRFAVTPGRDVTFRDLVRGDVTISTDVIGDFVIVRSDGRAAYNFAVVIDDHDMAITHVIRGEDHISNTPRQILIYEAMGASLPSFAHLSLVLGPHHAPLSKRHGATSVAEFRERGILPEALVNYLSLLGWSPGEGRELMGAADMRRFDLATVSQCGRLRYGQLALNRHYMKEAPPSRTRKRRSCFRAPEVTRSTEASRAFVESILPMAVGSVDRLEEIPERVAFLFDWTPERAAALVAAEADGARAVAAFAEELAGATALDKDTFRAAAGRAREKTGLKGRALFHPIRVALTAAESGPELDLAVPAIDRAAAIGAAGGLATVPACAARARAVAESVIS